MDNYPVEWAALIARAWLDDTFKAKLESDSESDRIEAFNEFNLTYEGSKPFTVPAPPPNLRLSDSRQLSSKQTVVVNTCTNSVRVKITIDQTDFDSVQIYDRYNKNDHSSFFEIKSHTDDVQIFRDNESEYIYKVDRK